MDPDGVSAPEDQKHHHSGGDVHNTKRFFAAFRNAFYIDPPKIESYKSGKDGRREISGEMNIEPRVAKQFIQESCKILAG